jgi:hypothetical protein
VSFIKTLTNPVNAQVTIVPVKTGATYTIEFGCPNTEDLTVKQIVINFNGDASLTTTTRYRWNLGTDLSPYNTNSVILESDGISLFQTQTGPVSFGTIPTEGATVKMESRQSTGQSFIFDPYSDKLKYLVSNVNYNEADINTLIPLLNNATPIVGNSTNYEADFVYSNASNDDYLYLVWDLREPTPLTLCYDTNITDACCGCVLTLYTFNVTLDGGFEEIPVWTTKNPVTGLVVGDTLYTNSTGTQTLAIGSYWIFSNEPGWGCTGIGVPRVTVNTTGWVTNLECVVV